MGHGTGYQALGKGPLCPARVQVRGKASNLLWCGVLLSETYKLGSTRSQVLRGCYGTRLTIAKHWA